MSDVERTERPEPTAWEHEHLHDPLDHADAHEGVSGPLRTPSELRAIALLDALDDPRTSFVRWDEERRAFLAGLGWNPAKPPEPESANPHAMRWG